MADTLSIGGTANMLKQNMPLSKPVENLRA